MPPKKDTTADDEAGGNSLGLSSGDVSFLLDCLKFPSGGAVAIDVKAVAELRNQKNHKSVSNRIAALKKKYNLPITSGSSSVASNSDPTGPVILANNRVTKTRVKTTKKDKKSTEEVSEEVSEDEKMEVEEHVDTVEETTDGDEVV